MNEAISLRADGKHLTKPPVARYHYDDGIPSSWYCVAWSEEVSKDSILDLRYFGADLICFRAASGEVRIFDAHCPHLGAHLGDGCIKNDEVVCPFHGWRFNSEGENTLIPYADRPSRQGLKPWNAHEVNGMVFVWYDPSGAQPTWNIPNFDWYGHDDYLDYYPEYCRTWRGARLHPQQGPENTTDPAHVTFVHHAAEVPEIVEHGADGPVFRTTLQYTWGGGKGSSWLTPDGPIDGGLIAECWGLGFVGTKFFGIHPTLQMVCMTPVDEKGRISDIRCAIIGAKGNIGSLTGAEFARRLAGHFCDQVDADIPIWARQTLIEHPPYPKLEARAYRDMREWASKFYTQASKD